MPVLLIAAVGAAAGLYAATKGEGAPASAPPLTSQRPPDGAAAPNVVPPANVGTPAPPPPTGDGGVAGELAAKAAEKALEVVFGASASTVRVGFQVADIQRKVLTSIAGEGAGNMAAVFGPVAGVTLAAKTAAEKLGAHLGIPADINRRLAQTAGLAVGAPALVGIKVTAEAVSLGIRAVAGVEAERAVRDVVKVFDITDSKNAIHAPVAAVAEGVTFVANALKGVFAPPPTPAAKVGMPIQGDMSKWTPDSSYKEATPKKKPAKLRVGEETR
jgi:hypothetical protein